MASQSAKTNYSLCDTYESIADVVGAISHASILILDCEARDIGCTNGVLSLISISDVDAKSVFLIDALAFQDPSHPALQPLFDLLRNDAVMKLMWDGRADALELRETYGIELAGVLDLQLAEVVSRKSARGEMDDFRRKRLASGYFRDFREDISRNPDNYAGIHPVAGMNACLRGRGINASKDDAVVALQKAEGSGMWLQRPLPQMLLQYAAHDLKLISLLYSSFLRSGWVKQGDIPLLRQQSTRYIRAFHGREVKDLWDNRHLAMFVPLNVLEATPANVPLVKCDGCEQQLALHCFPTTLQGGVRRRSTFCKLCAALAKRNSETSRGDWVAV